MKTIETGRIAERGYQLSQTMGREFGDVYVPDPTAARLVTRQQFIQTLRRGRRRDMPGAVSCIPLNESNLPRLTEPDAIGRTFGVMNSNLIVYGGVITDRTRPGELHFTRLTEGGGVPLDEFRGVDDLGRIMIEVGGLIQRPGVGSVVADQRADTASEIGHAMQGLSALTDATALGAMRRGGHMVHDWSGAGSIAAELSRRTDGTSAFAIKTEHGLVDNGFAPELVIKAPMPGLFLVDHEAITDEQPSSTLGVRPAELAMGMGLLAAETQLERAGTQLEDQVLEVMRGI